MPPDMIDCNCGGKGERLVDGAPHVKHGRNSHHSLKERMRYAHQGMDKKQAETFYKESVEATKERVKSGHQHYKKVVPNMKVLESQGLAKRREKQDHSDTSQFLKNANRSFTKDGTIGKKPRK